MKLQDRIKLLSELGYFLRTGGDEGLDTAIEQSYFENGWFTASSVRLALTSLSECFLEEHLLRKWADSYVLEDSDYPKRSIGIVMAGNIPLVGFHDWLCVFVSGNRALVKLSDKDKCLLPYLVKKMAEWMPESWAYTEFVTEGNALKGYDAVIATGSNNSARYFKQYFSKVPHIIRGNRHSVAVLNGMETTDDIRALGLDMFSYFGLGCRNVSKLYVPHGYQFDMLLEVLHEYNELALHNKYKNNFDYNFTLFILNSMPHLNNGCLLLREDASLSSRIASAHYEYYGDIEEVDSVLESRKGEIQCVISNMALKNIDVLPFGASQKPSLVDYADGVDVMAFLTEFRVGDPQ